MNFEALKQKYIQALLDTKSFLIKPVSEEPFTLRSGKKSYMFLDHAQLASSAKAYRAYIDVLSALIRDTYGEREVALCNVDSKISAQMVGSLAYISNYPQIIYKSQELTAVEKGTNKSLTGNYAWDGPIAIIDDVASGGDGTAKNVADLVKTAFPKAEAIQIFVGFVREIKKSTYRTNQVITRTELLQKVWDTLSQEQQQAVEEEIDEKFEI